MKRNFANWLNTFTSSISTYDYYVDFPKVYRNVDKIKVELNILNSLIGMPEQTDEEQVGIEDAFSELLEKYPEILKCIPILLAVRVNEIYAMDEEGSYLYDFQDRKLTNEQYVTFMRKTGLFHLMSSHIIHNLVDYVTGVETGLDSNGRKNRGGHLMENLVQRYIEKAGFCLGHNYFKEMYIHEITDRWGIDLSNISNQGKMEKRFDYVVKTADMIYGIETNFYTSGGSKLNETARSYKTIALEAAQIPGFSFVWFTDGKGWTSARHNLEETFDVLEHVYNINDMKNGIMKEIFK